MKDPDPFASDASAARSENQHANQPVEIIPVVEEQVQVGKRIVDTGSVRFTKKVHEEEITVNEPIVQEEVDVVRVPINQFVETPPPPVRHEGDKMIISVLKEEIVVEKRLLLVEELHVTRRRHTQNSTQQVTVRKEEVRVAREDQHPGNSERP